MTESPFVTISKIIQEETLLSDTLDFIASDTKGIPQRDRDKLREAAEEMRHMRQLIGDQAEAISLLTAQVSASSERIKALTAQPIFTAIDLYTGRPVNLPGI